MTRPAPILCRLASALLLPGLAAAYAPLPAATPKRLGDGFYEQRLICEQVAQPA